MSLCIFKTNVSPILIFRAQKLKKSKDQEMIQSSSTPDTQANIAHHSAKRPAFSQQVITGLQ